jgi:class 3 adenylate cyclase
LEYQRAIGNDIPEEMASEGGRISRNACTPDVAKRLSAIWYATDVRSILPAVRCPTLLLVRGDADPESEASLTASLIPGAELRALPEGQWGARVDTAAVEEIRSFVGVEPPVRDLDTVLASVLFTDIVGSTARQASLGDAVWKELIERHHAAIRSEIDRWGGAEVDTAGDGFYATFEGPARAVRCALEISDQVRKLGLEIRAGVHVGECTRIDGKIGGLPVTIGARIAARANGSEILVSQTVKDLVPGSGLVFEDAGEHELKGVPDRWHLYRVVG